jgi:predicted DNA-binding transcriptional regulator AlpA
VIQQKRQWLKTAQAAQYLGCSESHLYRLRNEGVLKQNTHYRIMNPTALKLRLQWDVLAIERTWQGEIA